MTAWAERRGHRVPGSLGLLIFALLLLAEPVERSQAAAPSEPGSDFHRPTRRGEVAIFRDDWGVPHIYAVSDEDAVFGAGYAYAEDDMPGLLRALLRVEGRAAEEYGSAELPWDLFARQWRIGESAKAAFAGTDPRLRALLRAYVAGIERYLIEHPRARPSIPLSVQAHHPLAIAFWLNILVSIQQDRQGLEDCAASGAQVSAGIAPQGSLGGVFAASNQWVLAPSRTRDGVVMVWADSHTPFHDLLGRREIRIHGATLHAAGVQAAGLPFPIIATTPYVAWALAVGGPDVSDCYEVILERDDPDHYRVDGRLMRVSARNETIRVRDGLAIVKRFEEIKVNGLAPVVSRAPGRLYAVSTAYVTRPDGLLRQLLAMNTADDLAAFKRALAMQGHFPQNIMAGDAKGKTLFVSAGLTPVRAQGFNWNRAVSGNTRQTAWQGFHALEDLVQLYDPLAGFMLNTNIAADAITQGHDRPRAEDYPAYVLNDRAGRSNERALRATALLSQARSVTERDLLQIGFDELLPLTPLWQTALRNALAHRSGSAIFGDAERKLTERLLAFDGYATQNSSDALAYYYWRRAVNETTAKQPSAEAIATAIESGRALSPDAEEVLLNALARAVLVLARLPNGANTEAGSLFRVGRGAASWPVGGFSVPHGLGLERTLRSMSCEQPSQNEACFVTFGQRHPIFTVFTSPPRSFMAVPWGQSEAPHSQHFSDQAALASRRELKPTYLAWQDLRPAIRSVHVMNTGLPAGR